MGKGELDLGELVSRQVVDRVANDVVDVDRSNLVDQHSGRPTGDVNLGAVTEDPAEVEGRMTTATESGESEGNTTSPRRLPPCSCARGLTRSIR